MVDSCFYCGETLKSDICSLCGYEHSLSLQCPRRINEGMLCIHNRQVCKETKNWMHCKILRAND